MFISKIIYSNLSGSASYYQVLLQDFDVHISVFVYNHVDAK